MNDSDKHRHLTNQFIELANQLKDQDYPVPMISAALMSASAIYATYSVAGNRGGLNPSGIDKVVATYRSGLEHIQRVKKAELEQNKPDSAGG